MCVRTCARGENAHAKQQACIVLVIVHAALGEILVRTGYVIRTSIANMLLNYKTCPQAGRDDAALVDYNQRKVKAQQL